MFYTDFIKEMKALPTSYLLGVLAELLKHCQGKSLFKDRDGLIRFCQKVLNEPEISRSDEPAGATKESE